MYDKVLRSRPFAISAYALVSFVIVFELAIVWLIFNPNVSADYRAYYIDRTTTCLNQPISGEYSLGQDVSFTFEGRDLAQNLKVCGWDLPSAEGTDTLGSTARLRFRVGPKAGPLHLTLHLMATPFEGGVPQRVLVRQGKLPLGTAKLVQGAPVLVDYIVPAAPVPGGDRIVEIAFDLPDAQRFFPGDSDIRLQSITLVAARLSSIW